jgi:hypothetical protein
MTNAIGFYENKREELLTGEHFGRDPNRDFAFNLHPGESCAKTAAGQVCQSHHLFLPHVFMNAI